METLKIPKNSPKAFKIFKSALLGDEIPKAGQPGKDKMINPGNENKGNGNGAGLA